MKKYISLALTVLIFFSAFVFSSCSAGKLYSEGQGELKVVCSAFPAFDFAREVGAEHATYTLLQDNGADLHSYTPSVSALKAVGEADVFICIGGTSDEAWVSDILNSASNTDLKVIKLTECVPELICAEAESDASHNEHDHDHAEDEHVWTSLKNAAAIVDGIAKAFSEADPEHSSDYLENSELYKSALFALDEEYSSVFNSAKHKIVVFADRFPFVYLFNDYSFPYLAAFSGCSTETDADYETLAKINEAVKNNGLSHIFIIDASDGKFAKSVSESAGCEILMLDSLQSLKRSDIQSGVTYLKIMKSNLDALRTALGVK